MTADAGALMHPVAVILIAVAGAAYCAAGWLRWRALMRQAGTGRALVWPLGAGLALHTASVVLAIGDTAHAPFLYGALGSWAAIASVVFLARFLAVPSTRLLALPIGGMALLVAVSSATGDASGHAAAPDIAERGVVLLHIVFMSTHLAAILIAGAAAALHLAAVRQLKSASPGALRLPSLPLLEHLTERSLVVATALLIGGLATGGVLMRRTPGFDLLHPTAVIALGTMALLVVALALRVAQKINRRGLALMAMTALALSAMSLVSLMTDRHG